MPSTSTYAFRYPALADPPNVPAAVQNLAVDVETELNKGGIVARNQRTTNLGVASGQTGNLIRVISTSGAVRVGRSYKVTAHAEVYSEGAPATVQAELRYTTDGSEPAPTSALLNRWLGRLDTLDIPQTVTPAGVYTPQVAGTLSVVLCVRVFLSSGSYQVGGLPGYPAEITIEDAGPARATTGTIFVGV